MTKYCLPACVLCLLQFFSGSGNGAWAAPAPAGISPEARQYLETAKVGRLPSPENEDAESLDRLRAMLAKIFLRAAEKIDPDVYLTDQALDSTSGVWVNGSAPDSSGPILLYLHGGGFVLGSAKTNLGTAVRLRNYTGLPVLSVEYRLAPEHPYPAALQDALAAYRWLLNEGFAAGQIGVYGDSAGGTLALALVLAAREADLPLPGALALLSPVTDLTGSGDSAITLLDWDPIIRSDLSKRYEQYIGAASPHDPLVSPVHGDYSGFPPILVQAGSREALLSDSLRLVRKARTDGATVQLDVWDGMWHVWQDTPALPEAEAACAELGDFFMRQLGNPKLLGSSM